MRRVDSGGTAMLRILILALLMAAQENWPEGRGVVEVPKGERIAFFGTLAAAQAEAARVHKPLLLVAAAPECQNTPGVW
jgi:hypothetical protein